MLIAERKLVGELIGFDICPSPAWDILLDLYAARLSGDRVYIWSLCTSAHIPDSSAHRKIAGLIAAGLLERSSDASDGRRVAMTLSSAAIVKLDAVMDAMLVRIRAWRQASD